jgi:hypothetical protein
MRLEFLHVEHAPRLSTFRTSNADDQQKETRMGLSGDLIDTADKGNKFLNNISQGIKQGASCTIHEHNGNLLNGNHHHHP